MPIILQIPQDPTDMVLQGEQMRISAIDEPVNALTGFSSVVQDEDAFAPMNSFIEGNRLSIRRLKNGTLMMRQNAGIVTPCGAWIWLDYSPLINPAMWHSGGWALTGVTRNSAGAALGGCRVMALDVGQIAITGAPIVAESISDGSGNYSVPVPLNTAYQVIAYKSGSPDVGGVSLNTITPVNA